MTSASNGKTGKLNELIKLIRGINTESGWIVVGLAIQAAVWPLFITATERGHISAWAIFSIVLALTVNLVFLIFSVRPSDLIGVITIFVSAVLVLTGTFSYYYWECGTTKNFTINLTHFDAFYFAIGTLTTGTGNISATSTISRVLQSLQMTTDFILIVFIAGIIIARLSSRWQGPPSKGDIR
jgi:hypothetical protein